MLAAWTLLHVAYQVETLEGKGELDREWGGAQEGGGREGQRAVAIAARAEARGLEAGLRARAVAAR